MKPNLVLVLFQQVLMINNSMESKIHKRMTLPIEDRYHMPPKSRTQPMLRFGLAREKMLVEDTLLTAMEYTNLLEVLSPFSISKKTLLHEIKAISIPSRQNLVKSRGS